MYFLPTVCIAGGCSKIINFTIFINNNLFYCSCETKNLIIVYDPNSQNLSLRDNFCLVIFLLHIINELRLLTVTEAHRNNNDTWTVTMVSIIIPDYKCPFFYMNTQVTYDI